MTLHVCNAYLRFDAWLRSVFCLISCYSSHCIQAYLLFITSSFLEPAPQRGGEVWVSRGILELCCLEPSGPVGSPMANWSRRREHTSGSRTQCEVNKLWWFRFTNQKTSPWFFCNTCNIYESWELDIVVRIEHVLRASVEFVARYMDRWYHCCLWPDDV